MIKKSNFYPALLSMILGVILLFGATSNGFAGEPGPEEETAGRPSGGVFTVVTLYIFDRPFAVASIVGECSGNVFLVGPIVDDPIVPTGEPGGLPINTIEASQLENLVLRNADPTKLCYPDLDTPDLVITNVKNFIKSDTAIRADVTLRAVVSSSSSH